MSNIHPHRRSGKEPLWWAEMIVKPFSEKSILKKTAGVVINILTLGSIQIAYWGGKMLAGDIVWKRDSEGSSTIEKTQATMNQKIQKPDSTPTKRKNDNS